MNFLQYEFDLSAGDVVEVTLDKQANVRLLDRSNFVLFRNGHQHRDHGGYENSSPVRLVAPHGGHWYVVVDLGGNAGTVHASTRVLQGA
jgi:hypothetical protein